MPDLFCEWGGDLIVTPNGGIQSAVGWDNVRQRIIRSLITNSAQRLPDGSTTAPDYIYHPSYGIGCGSLVGQNPTPQYISGLVGRINQAVLQDVAVDPGSVPSVLFQVPRPGTWLVFVTVSLRDKTVGQTAVQITT